MGDVPVLGGPALGADVAKWYGIPGLVDQRENLPWYSNGGPTGRTNLSMKHRLVFHYRGTPANMGRSDLENIQSDALYHIQRNWGEGEPVVRGNGLMYHFAISRQGVPYLTRTAEHWSWHATAGWANREAIAVYIPIGGDQVMTAAQRDGAMRFARRWLAVRGGKSTDIFGHGDVFSSHCPGGSVREMVAELRSEGSKYMADTMFFEQTGFVIGGAFLEHWQRTGGLTIHGYPLSNEFDISDGSAVGGRRTVQVFERSVLEWWPENDAEFKVQGQRLGAGVLDDLERQRLE